jgi:hypothetical protein
VNLRYPFLFIFLIISCVCLADDVGVSEARLIEEDNNTYVLEVDVSPSLINTIQAPILPENCSFIGKPERVPVGPMLVVRYRFSSGSKPLQPEDKLLLYWQRSGIILTTYWLDGSSKKVFFDRQLSGFLIQVSSLRDMEVSRKKLILKGNADAQEQLKELWIVFLLLMVAFAVGGLRIRLFQFVMAFAGGHGLSLLILDMGMPILPSSMISIAIALTSLFLFMFQLQVGVEKRRLWAIPLLLGLMHGHSYSGPSFEQAVSLTKVDLLTARLFYNLLIDGVVSLGSLFLYLIFAGLRKWEFLKRFQRAVIYTGGGLAIASILFFLPGIWTPTEVEKGVQLSDLSGNMIQTSNSGVLSKPVDMEDPIMGFITITPFEIRCEWLMRARDLHPETIQTESGKEVIPVDIQDSFKLDLMTRMAADTRIIVEGKPLKAAKIRADFVSVGSYGVSTRSKPVPEAVDRAVVGITLAYSVPDAPSFVSVELTSYTGQIEAIPISFTDPWGTTASAITAQRSQVEWKARMAGFRRPVIQPVRIEALTWPALSMGLSIAALGLLLLKRKKDLIPASYILVILLLGISVLVYPFSRWDAPSSISRKVGYEEAGSRALGQLLTNIYRAFDYQTEEAVYDQLAISTLGDQLTVIYLEHQSAMKLEERGGARANVDQVQILEVKDMKRTKEDIWMDASWVVSGSVSHFGHIHYRKNRYDARVYVRAVDDVWKISGIEVKEKERIL